MAQEETKNETSEKKSGNLLLIVIIVVLALIIVVGAVITVLLMGSDEPQQQVQNTQQQSSQVRTPARVSTALDDGEDNRRLSEIGILYPLDTFTVNLKSDAGRRYLKVTMSLELNGKHIAAELDNKIPVIRDKVIRILTSKTLEEIASPKGKQKVSLQVIDTLNTILSDGQIKGLYFTEFVIQ